LLFAQPAAVLDHFAIDERLGAATEGSAADFQKRKEHIKEACRLDACFFVFVIGVHRVLPAARARH
jgi:hypothetical protein